VILTTCSLVTSWPAVLPPKELVTEVVKIFLKRGDAVAKMFDGPELLHRVQSSPLSRRFPVSYVCEEETWCPLKTSRSCHISFAQHLGLIHAILAVRDFIMAQGTIGADCFVTR
jgi:hypothetical protein